jgi:4-amino-4-deoxy-L-arabinose transferase-like glycosyltransferase
VIFIAIATAYNLLVPLYEAPDERVHVAYVDAIQRTGSIPEIRADTYEAAGPPLYHAAGAGVLKLLGLSPPLIAIPPNPEFPGQPNNFLHTPTEDDLPFRGAVLSIHVLRAVSTLFGAGTVVFVYLIVRLLFPRRPLLAWSAGANTALLPQFAFVSGAVMNDTAVAFFSAASIYFSFRVMKEGWGIWLLGAAGSLALGFLTEASMGIAAAVCASAVLFFSPMSWRRRVLAVGLLAAVPIAAAGWFYLDHLIQYGEFFPIDAMRSVIPLGAELPLGHPKYRGDFQSLLDRSYWFVGGAMNIFVVDAMYQFLDILAGMAVGGAIVILVRRNISAFQQQGILLLGALLLLALLEIIYVSVRISYQPQGRYLFVAQPAIALLLAMGLAALFQRDTQRDHVASLLMPVILLGLNLGILTLTLPTVY